MKLWLSCYIGASLTYNSTIQLREYGNVIVVYANKSARLYKMKSYSLTTSKSFSIHKTNKSPDGL
jgi:hypothetical protein